MPLFYERKESADKIVIKYKYYLIFYISLLITIFITRFVIKLLFKDISFSLYLFLLFIVAVIFMANIWKPHIEIRRAMKKGVVEISGRKFSFSDPLTAVIKKK